MDRLQLGFEVNTDKDPEYEIRITPVDIELPPHIALAAKAVEAYLDSLDAHPGDGEADIAVKKKIPVKINLYITKLNTTYELDGNIFLNVKDAE